jgi:transposase
MSASGLAAHLSPAELGQRYRAARSPIERSHLQIVWLLSRGLSEREVAQVTGYGRRWIAEIVGRYDREGPDGLGDRRRGNAGARPLLGAEDEAALRAALARPPSDGGLWTGPKVAAWMAARLGRKVWPQRGWDYLRKLGHSPQVPRPRHAKAASPEEQAAYKKKLAATVDEHRKEHPDRAVEVWAFDEHRVGLKPVLRRQWAPRGRRPVAVGHPRYEWLYLYGFVHPDTGEVVWFVCSTVDAELLGAVLAAFAEEVGAGEGKLVILVLDNAGWHVSGDLVVPKGIELAFLPPYTPELQPAEHLWPLANEAVANKHFATLKDLDAALSERCRTLADMPDVIKAETHFGWWPAAAPASVVAN